MNRSSSSNLEPSRSSDTLRHSHSWEVHVSPRGFHRSSVRIRRVSIEVHRSGDGKIEGEGAGQGSAAAGPDEEVTCLLRIMEVRKLRKRDKISEKLSGAFLTTGGGGGSDDKRDSGGSGKRRMGRLTSAFSNDNDVEEGSGSDRGPNGVRERVKGGLKRAFRGENSGGLDGSRNGRGTSRGIRGRLKRALGSGSNSIEEADGMSEKLGPKSNGSIEDDDDDDASISFEEDSDRDFIYFSPHCSLLTLPPVPGFDVLESEGGGSRQPVDEGVWTTWTVVPLERVSIDKIQGPTVVFTHGGMAKKMKRATFDGNEEARAFGDLVRLLNFAPGRALDDLGLDADERLELLMDVVSCWGLPAIEGPRPLNRKPNAYVVALMGNRVVHRTKDVVRTSHPIYTIKTNSLFILSVTARELFGLPRGLCFEVKDNDLRGSSKDRSLGAAWVTADKLVKANEERLEMNLVPLAGEKKYRNEGKIAIRCRRATLRDKEFMRAFRRGVSLEVTNQFDVSGEGGTTDMKTITTKYTKKGPDGEKLYRLRPKPDPKRPSSTKWQTKEVIHREALEPSHHWLDAGTGQLGKVFLEVIGCDNIPNLDHGGHLGNKTDAYVTVVHESTVVKTDVIANCLSPRWPPWSQRAFVLRMTHSSSQVFLAINDYDSGPDKHDVVGRVAVDILALRPNTEYFLSYDIFNSDDFCTRKPRGSISVRVMIDIEDQRKMFLSGSLYRFLNPMHVSTKNKKDLRAVRYATKGSEGDSYGRKEIQAYIEELLSNWNLIRYLAVLILKRVLFWRCHFPLHLGVPKTKLKITIFLPLNSMVAFSAGIILVEHPSLIPSFFLLLVAWVLSTIPLFLGRDPSPWAESKSFWELFWIFVLAKPAPPLLIEADPNAKQHAAFRDEFEAEVRSFEEAGRLEYEERSRKLRDFEEDFAEIAADVNVDISTEVKIRKPDPLIGLWRPIQEVLRRIVQGVRFVRHILFWHECHLSFLVSLSSYILAFVFLVVPWAFLLRWFFRILVWGLLGPWMKLVDLYWESKINPALKRMQEKSFNNWLQLRAIHLRTQREKAAKMKQFQKRMFGRYISKVPTLNISKYRDIPLPTSNASPINNCEDRTRDISNRSKRVVGHNIVGELIPVLEAEDNTSTELETLVKKPDAKHNKDAVVSELSPLMSQN